MKESYNIYCVSNASKKKFKDNDLSCFKNALPQNVDLKNKQWEIGIVKFGFQFETEKLENLTMVSISTDVVIDSPNGNKYSTLIYDTSLPKSARDKYFHHYVKHIKYFPIRNTFIDTITTKFLDINGKKLLIEKGQPSFVHYHLRTMHSEENYKLNYIRLDSENTNMEQSNTNSNFWVHLKDSIDLNEKSEVALVNINFPNLMKNISTSLSEKNIIISVREELEDLNYSVKIPAAYYPSAATLIQALKSNLPNELKKNLLFNIKNGKLQIASKDKTIVFRFPIELINILGINLDKSYYEKIRVVDKYVELAIINNGKYIAPNPINVMYYYPNVMLCYTNFVKHSIVGNSYFPILKIIPIETPSIDYVSVHFDYLEFISTNVKYLKDLHFEFKNLNGDLIEFADNRKIILNFVVKNK